jgi:hypothetical protein
MMHFANCQGYIQSAPFIQAITAQVWRTRNLGSTNAESDRELPNEVDYSISANMGLTYREDIDGRIRKIELEFFEENENGRVFPNAFLHDWVMENRSRAISAFAAFTDYWIEKKMPKGDTPFNSFPQWANVVGGIMQTCELGNPCLPDKDKDSIGGDKKTIAMQGLYERVYELHPNEWLNKQKIFSIIEDNQELDDRLEWFGDFSDQRKKQTCMRIGLALKTFKDRIFGGVAMRMDISDSHSERHKIRFEPNS